MDATPDLTKMSASAFNAHLLELVQVTPLAPELVARYRGEIDRRRVKIAETCGSEDTTPAQEARAKSQLDALNNAAAPILRRTNTGGRVDKILRTGVTRSDEIAQATGTALSLIPDSIRNQIAKLVENLPPDTTAEALAQLLHNYPLCQFSNSKKEASLYGCMVSNAKGFGTPILIEIEITKKDWRNRASARTLSQMDEELSFSTKITITDFLNPSATLAKFRTTTEIDKYTSQTDAGYLGEGLSVLRGYNFSPAKIGEAMRSRDPNAPFPQNPEFRASFPHWSPLFLAKLYKSKLVGCLESLSEKPAGSPYSRIGQDLHALVVTGDAAALIEAYKTNRAIGIFLPSGNSVDPTSAGFSGASRKKS